MRWGSVLAIMFLRRLRFGKRRTACSQKYDTSCNTYLRSKLWLASTQNAPPQNTEELPLVAASRFQVSHLQRLVHNRERCHVQASAAFSQRRPVFLDVCKLPMLASCHMQTPETTALHAKAGRHNVCEGALRQLSLLS